MPFPFAPARLRTRCLGLVERAETLRDFLGALRRLVDQGVNPCWDDDDPSCR